MTAETTSANNNTPKQMMVGAQYIRDFSFETPNAPHIFASLGSAAPTMNFGFNVHAQPLTENKPETLFEVVLALKLEAKIADKIAFIAELSYGGVFTLPVMPEEDAKAMTLIECPRILFPFARGIITHAVMDGGFPPISMQPIDFAGLYLANKDKVGNLPPQGRA